MAVVKLEGEPSGEQLSCFICSHRHACLHSFHSEEVHEQFALWMTVVSIAFIAFGHLCSKYNATGKTLRFFLQSELSPVSPLPACYFCIISTPSASLQNALIFGCCWVVFLIAQPLNNQLPHPWYNNSSNRSPKIIPSQICFPPRVDSGENQSVV